MAALIWIRSSSSKSAHVTDQQKVFKDQKGQFYFSSLKLKDLDGYNGKELVLIGELSRVNAPDQTVSLFIDSLDTSVEIALPQNDFLISFSQPSSSEPGAYASTLLTSQRLLDSLGRFVGKMVEVRVLYELEPKQVQELRRTCTVSVCALLDMWSFYEKNNSSFFANPSNGRQRIGPMTQLFLGADQ